MSKHPKHAPSSPRLPPQKPTQPPKPLSYKPASRTSSIPSPRTTPSPSTVRRYRRYPLILASGVAFIGGAYLILIYTSLSRPPPSTHAVPADVTSRYDSIAASFDAEVGSLEYWTGVTKLRRKLASKAQGDVLEVSAGTGRNIDFFDLKKCTSVTLVDLSGPMLEIAKKKWRDKHPGYKNVTFLQQSALEPIASPGGKGFDTVVQTMGLCSTPEPERLLRNLGEVVKEEGRILLLEHGRSHYAWLNRLLDNSAPLHADKYGCWWNKDIGAIVERSGLEVVKCKRKHLGTTWWLELKPPQRRSKSDESSEDASGEQPLETEQREGAAQELGERPEKRWWEGWWY